MATQKTKFYIATILNPQNDKQCDFYTHGLLVTEGSGRAAKIKDILPLEKGVKKYGAQMTKRNTIDFGHAAIMPGFFDMHFHWVQDDVRAERFTLRLVGKIYFPNRNEIRRQRLC
jgi:guanine deaminase